MIFAPDPAPFSSDPVPHRISRPGVQAPTAFQSRAERLRSTSKQTVGDRLARLLAENRPIVAELGNTSPTYRLSKRVLDVTGAAVLLGLLSPILLAAALVLFVTTKGRPFFAQERIGLCGRKFRMFKFRTMHLNAAEMQANVKNEKDGPIFKNRHDPRITRIGRILRRTSIDELPQLLNVLVGQMSLVGPRPPVEKEVLEYEPWQLRRLAIKPGLTCLWQVSGRSEIAFCQWVRMDLWYLKNQNLRTDLSLLVRTPLSVLTCRGAY